MRYRESSNHLLWGHNKTTETKRGPFDLHVVKKNLPITLIKVQDEYTNNNNKGKEKVKTKKK